MDAHAEVNAPKDPKKKGRFFYLYKDLKLEPVLHKSGKRISEIYLDSGRIKSAVKINGAIEDDAIIDIFDDAKRTQEFIKGLGVSISAENNNAEFLFGTVFYGKEDKYNSGTHIYTGLSSNDVEQYIDFSECEFKDDDDVLGRFDIQFPDGVDIAAMSVKAYVDDDCNVPDIYDEEEVDITSEAYDRMIKTSLYFAGNNERFLKACEKAKAKEPVTVAFIGGSITQGAGGVPSSTECYAYKAYAGFKALIEKTYGIKDADIRYIRSGIGGTPSELGVIRYDKDVTDFGEIKPDIVIVEFAVNDADDETNGDCYEGLMRKIWNSENKPALILLFSVFADDFNLQERFIPIGEKYGVPMISVKDAVLPEFSKERNGGVISRRQYFYDVFHPSNIGHTVMADCLINYFKEVVKMPLKKDIEKPPVVRSDDFDNIVYFDRKYFPGAEGINYYKKECYTEAMKKGIKIIPGGFNLKDDDLHSVERDFDNFETPCFPDNWMHEPGDNTPFTVTLECRVLLVILKDTERSDFGTVEICVDGKYVRSHNPLDVGWTHCNAVLVIRDEKVNVHTVEIRMADGSEQNYATILGFGFA